MPARHPPRSIDRSLSSFPGSRTCRLARCAGLLVGAAVALAACAAFASDATIPPTALRWEPEIRAYEEADRSAPPPSGGIVFVGSSSIRMWKTLSDDFPAWTTVNRGFGGAQIPDVTYYIDRLVLPHRPQHIVFYAGDNDLGDGRTPQQVAGDFEAFVARVRQTLPDVPVSFLSIKPSPARETLQADIDAANRAVRDWAGTRAGVVYLDVATPMRDAAGRARLELFKPDGLHLDEDGYRLWREIVGAHLRETMPNR